MCLHGRSDPTGKPTGFLETTMRDKQGKCMVSESNKCIDATDYLVHYLGRLANYDVRGRNINGVANPSEVL